LVVVPRSGHYPYLEAADAFAHEVLTFAGRRRITWRSLRGKRFPRAGGKRFPFAEARCTASGRAESTSAERGTDL
jgi:hypothetical protein